MRSRSLDRPQAFNNLRRSNQPEITIRISATTQRQRREIIPAQANGLGEGSGGKIEG